jgi:hypothetical protein
VKELVIYIVMIFVIILYACSQEQWEGVVYPDKNNRLIFKRVGKFQELEACRNASLKRLDDMNAIQKGFYECRKGCKQGAEGVNDLVCKETVYGNLYH